MLVEERSSQARVSNPGLSTSTKYVILLGYPAGKWGHYRPVTDNMANPSIPLRCLMNPSTSEPSTISLPPTLTTSTARLIGVVERSIPEQDDAAITNAL